MPLVVVTDEEIFEGVNVFIDGFQNSVGRDAIFIFSERFREPHVLSVIVDATDPRWVEISDRLEQNGKIYDNGYTQIYKQ